MASTNSSEGQWLSLFRLSWGKFVSSDEQRFTLRFFFLDTKVWARGERGYEVTPSSSYGKLVDFKAVCWLLYDLVRMCACACLYCGPRCSGAASLNHCLWGRVIRVPLPPPHTLSQYDNVAQELISCQWENLVVLLFMRAYGRKQRNEQSLAEIVRYGHLQKGSTDNTFCSLSNPGLAVPSVCQNIYHIRMHVDRDVVSVSHWTLRRGKKWSQKAANYHWSKLVGVFITVNDQVKSCRSNLTK